jgi:hypothetical protein
MFCYGLTTAVICLMLCCVPMPNVCFDFFVIVYVLLRTYNGCYMFNALSMYYIVLVTHQLHFNSILSANITLTFPRFETGTF